MLFDNDKIIELPTMKDYPVFVRKSAVVRIWNDGGMTAIMYTSNAVDHIKLSLEETLKKVYGFKMRKRK